MATNDPEELGRTSIALHDLLGLDFTWETGPGDTAEVRMPVRPAAFGFTNNLHGGAIATMIDLACALAAARSTGHDPTVESLITADMHIRYLGRARTDVVTAKASVVRAGSQLIVVDCDVVDGNDHRIAAADLSMMRVPLRRTPLDDRMSSVDGSPPAFPDSTGS